MNVSIGRMVDTVYNLVAVPNDNLTEWEFIMGSAMI